ncbi:MAG: hypothetical protein K9N07_00345 [Candidatus Cloacimonetes bacterium]|nr:hypothetical protein [Candidatus Cloacimonadota bacterium]
MKKAILALFVIINFSSCARKTIYINIAPPRNKTEIRSERPGENYVWVEGRWHWDHKKDNYVWIRGHWMKKKKGNIWIPGSWERTRRGWIWTEGYWK